MVRLAYAVARSDMQEPGALPPQPVRGDSPRRNRPTPVGRSLAFVRQTMAGATVLVLLAAIGWGAARVLDSYLLGFVFADLAFLAGMAIRGTFFPARGHRP